jgi:hypothetical protein
MPRIFHARRPLVLSFILICLVLGTASMRAQGPGVGGNKRIEGKFKYMPIPYVNYDRSLGFSVGAVPLLMFNPSEKDTFSPSSLIGGLGFWTSNKTWFLMGFGMFYLDEDRWRITTAGGTGAVNYQFYLGGIINSWIPYESEADFFMLKVERRIIEQIYGGLSYLFADVVTRPGTLPLTDSLTLHRWGAVGFAGMAIVFEAINTSDNGRVLQGIGTGIRFRAFPENNFSVGVDVAAGLGDWDSYFQIGEAF